MDAGTLRQIVLEYEMQRNAEKFREMQRNAKKCIDAYMQRYPHDLHDLYDLHDTRKCHI